LALISRLLAPGGKLVVFGSRSADVESAAPSYVVRTVKLTAEHGSEIAILSRR